ncbi:hypothetical protein G9A89_023463 [Geosiphon pyriformis]|nr:hypothetical protein G9A89_023463 [Geosiphon pyriformis]
MEYFDILRTRPQAHSCDDCKMCQRNIKNKDSNLCEACCFLFVEKLYTNFSSGNETVDEIIKHPMFVPAKNERDWDRFEYYEWIPWERLSDISKIGQGGFGTIYKATWIDGIIDLSLIQHYGGTEYQRKKNKKVAIKFINSNSQNNWEIFKEINVQRAIFTKEHGTRFISKILGITQNPETLDYGLVMQLAQYGDMRKYLSTYFYDTRWELKAKYAIGVAAALSTLHSAGMIHRDLHSGNILQFSYESVAIGDFGLSRPANKEVLANSETKVFGVIPYIPPEVLKGAKHTLAGDVYSLGMILCEIATGKPPFHDRPHDVILIMNILNGERPDIASPTIPPCFAQIIQRCWDADPLKRPTSKEVKDRLFEMRDIDNAQFQEADTFVKAIADSNKLKKDISEYDQTTKWSTVFHPEAIYTSRLLTAQTVNFSTGLFNYVVF